MSPETTDNNKMASLEYSTTVPSTPRKPTTSDSILSTSPLTFTSNLPESSLELSTSAGFNVSTTSQTFGNTTFHSNQTYLHNYTDEEKLQYLSYLQDQTTKAMIPAMTYLIILATVGLVGNSLVLFVYSRKFRPTATRVFIMAIAAFDIVTNVVAIPGDIYDMFHIWDFDQPMLCKTRLFVNAFTTMVAAMVLVAVAVVRYRKICKPFKTQVSVKLAKILSVTLAVLSLTFSIPYAIINGRQTKTTPRPGISGYECTIDDGYIDTIWPLINGAFFIYLFVVCCIPLVVMYILIGITAWKHSKAFGAVAYTKGRVEPKSGVSGNSSDLTTRSTDESLLQFTKTPKTRSFVKKGDSPGGGLPAPSSQNSNDNKPHCYNNQVIDNKDRRHTQCKNYDDEEEANNADNLYDTSITGKANGGASKKTKTNNCDFRTVRSPTGETVHINLLMVKELTMKLKAVKKESESITDKNDDNCSEPWKADYEDKTFMSSIKASEDFNGKTQNIDNEQIDKRQADNGEDDKRFVKKKIHRNKSANNNLCDEVDKLSKSTPSKRFSKSLGDLTRLTVRHSFEKDKKKAAENEDLDLRSNSRLDGAGGTDLQKVIENEESETSKDEPMNEFAKAMQWVDLTYCLTEDQKENENGKNEANGDEPDYSTLSKKGSFAIGRKISRDNSFLQRHKKLKDALTDTLTRARRNKKEREAADAEGKDNHVGNAMLENINSESDNFCNDNDDDSGVNERRISEPAVQHEAKALKRKSSAVKEDTTSDESGNTIKVTTRHGVKRRGIGRTTCMLILISAVYILGFLPFLGLMFAKAASPNTFLFMDIPSEAVYNLFLRSYFLNSAANPIIYSLCDINFRRECLALMRRS